MSEKLKIMSVNKACSKCKLNSKLTLNYTSEPKNDECHLKSADNVKKQSQ